MVAALCGAFALPGAAVAQSDPQATSTVDTGRAAVAGVTLDLSRREVLRVLGRPIRRSGPEFDDLIGDSIRVWVYPAGRFVFYGDRLQEVHCTGRTCATRDGVRVGDPLARVIEVYGRPETSGGNGEDTYWYEIGHSDCSMSFVVRKGVIVEIRLDCDYT